MINKGKERLNLQDIQKILDDNKVLQGIDDDRNLIEIASALSLIELVELERVETGFFDKVDQRKMVQLGQLVVPIAFGQSVMQAVIPEDL